MRMSKEQSPHESKEEHPKAGVSTVSRMDEIEVECTKETNDEEAQTNLVLHYERLIQSIARKVLQW